MKFRTFAAALIAVGGLAGGGLMVVTATAAPPKNAQSKTDAPIVPSLASMSEKEIQWGMSHKDLSDVYNRTGGLIDKDYVARLAKLQPGVEQQQLEADRDNRKVNLERSFTSFDDTPTGFDVTPIHSEYTYRNSESAQRLFKDGKTRVFFYIKDRLWKIYDEVPLKADGALGATFQEAVTKLNTLFGVAARIRVANPSHGLERTEADWQDHTSHLRAVDRSSEHLVGIVLEDKNTIQNLSVLRSAKPVDPFAIDPAITAVTRGGVTDPNAARSTGNVDGGAGKGGRGKGGASSMTSSGNRGY